MMDPERPRVVIIGAGFAGLWAARTLAHSPCDVLLVDCNNYHTFPPLLYQVATAGLEPEVIAFPVRTILRELPNVHFAMHDVREIDFDARLLKAGGHIIPYDYLILAIGSVTNFFGVDGAAEYAFPLKTLRQAIALRNHILQCFELASHEPDASKRRRMLTFTVVGGGPTGVELTGALSELIHGSLREDHPSLDFGEVCVILLEAMDALLPGLPKKLQDYTTARLRRKGIDVRLQSPANQVTPEAVHLGDGTVISTETVVWTAGVRGEPQPQRWGLPMGRGGRVNVQPTLQVEGHPELYVIGDLAYLEQDGRPLPLMAPVAIQQGVIAAKNIMRQTTGGELLSFHYHDRGTMVTIGRNAAVANAFGYPFTGFLAWVLWLVFHLLQLIGFRNRLLALINWIWDYFLVERAVRLILP
jgi:NADH dehydrogenase